MQLEHVLIGLLVLVVAMAGYAGSGFPKPTWFGKAIAVVFVVLVALAIAQIVIVWSVSEREPIPIEPLVRNEVPISMPRQHVVDGHTEA